MSATKAEAELRVWLEVSGVECIRLYRISAPIWVASVVCSDATPVVEANSGATMSMHQ